MNTHEPDGYLVGGFNEKYVQVKLGSSATPRRDEHKKCLSCHHLVYEMFMNGCLN